jgi:L-lactate dehydrogenase complex protein LldG
MESELTALGGSFTRCREAEVAQRVLQLLNERGIRAIQAWEAAHLPEGILDVLAQGGIQVQHYPDPSLRLGLTAALAGIAETGSLVLQAGAGRPQTASLLPEIHVAILKAADIVPTLQEALCQPQMRDSSAVVLVSGPSRTADIEMTLTIGVHGPGELHVFCVE